MLAGTIIKIKLKQQTGNKYPFLQVYTGNYRQPSTTQVQTVLDLSGLEIGHLVVVNCANCDLEPLLGKVISINGEEVTIVWLEGHYNSSWRTSKQVDPANKRKKIDWTDTIPLNSIILYDFKLTSTNHLRKNTVTHLKRYYEQLKQHIEQQSLS